MDIRSLLIVKAQESLETSQAELAAVEGRRRFVVEPGCEVF